MKLPNFILIGAARCATTSMHKYLGAHPDVFLPEIKELNFFSNDRYYNKGLEWYSSHFSKADVRAIGEASTSYSRAIGQSMKVIDRMHKDVGTPKLVYIVRDPLDRLLSHYLHYQHRGQRVNPIDALLSRPIFEDTRWQGRYHHQLSLYRRVYAIDDILVITTRELKLEPNAVMNRVFRHIGVSTIDLPAELLETVVNSSSKSTQKSPAGQRLLEFHARHLEQRRIPYPFKKAVKYVAEIGAKPLGSFSFNETQIATLTDFYRQDSLALARDYGVNIDDWKVNSD
ncbi:MAG: sulfotransferase domain-containing protein [Pseudomonadota bacterium]